METFNYLLNLDVTYLHVFTYSERVNTLAVSMDNVVPVSLRKTRNRMLRNLSMKKQNAFYQSQSGTEVNVLFEAEKHHEMMYGYSSNYIRVAYPYDEEMINKIIPCKIININAEGFAEVELVRESISYSR